MNPSASSAGGDSVEKAAAGGAEAHALLDEGWQHKRAGDLEGANAKFLQAVRLAPDLPRAHLARAEMLLARGDLLAGWREFAWRRSFNTFTSSIVQGMTVPEWAGETMHEGRVLVVCDEGIGDAIMFARYLPKVAERVGTIVIAGGADAGLFERIAGVSIVYGSPEAGSFDAFVLICDLPRIFGTTLESVPAEIPYLTPDAVRMREWDARLRRELPAGAPRVGINWSGAQAHVNDARRSLAFEQLAGMLAVPGIGFVSLQKTVRESDRAALEAAGNVLDVAQSLRSLLDTAALIANLDLVVTVDTAVAHLAGALGARTWVLLPTPADWRWLIGRLDTPWYPTMRLFRQPACGDWGTVLREAEGFLRLTARSAGS